MLRRWARYRRPSRRRIPLSQQGAGLKHGWRSGLEKAVAEQLAEAERSFSYESEKLRFTQPAKDRTYTPDFVLTTKSGRKIYVETKGLWTRDDRMKFKWVLECNPDIDLRFVFQRAKTRIDKRSVTTYADVADRLKCKWAEKRIPQEWLDE